MKKALVVDDSRAIRTIVRRILVAEGFDVAEACDGREAVKALQGSAASFDLLCTDYNMPEMNGIDLLRRVRRMPQCKALPALMITTETHVQSMENAYNAGANEYLMKPFTADMMRDKLRMLGLLQAVAL
ncbi:MAG: response regulator [Janthinobacterium lividum]